MHGTLLIVRRAKLIKNLCVRIKGKAKKEDVMVGNQSLKRLRCSLIDESTRSLHIAAAGPGALGT